MALSARLNLRQSQSMVMTPQLLQSIKLLQFTHAELQQFVDEQIESNPLLERVGESSSGDAVVTGEAREIAPADNDWADVSDTISTGQITDVLEAPMENVFQDDSASGSEAFGEAAVRSGPGDGALPFSGQGDTDFSLEDMAASGETLRDHVINQIAFVYPQGPKRLIALELADALDERGYVDFDCASICERLGASEADVEEVLSALQELDPPGIFARDLAECLALQCRRRDRHDPAMATLLDNLELLAKRDFKTLCRLCAVDEADLLDMLAEIRQLDPRPGLAFDPGPTETIVHDVDVREAPDGTWRIELNADALPRVIVNREYMAVVQRGSRNAEERSFVSQCMQDATWLERSLDQRATTILKVATEIVRQQDEFFVKGVSGLKPMTMKMVADAISMHESTVSRVASNKYMLTPRGMFEFRYFFTVAISGTDGSGDDHSSESVRQRIRQLIDEEAPEKVLSDDNLVDKLKEEGIDIARRTVAKYRESMNIASSVQRRREKRAQQRVLA